MRVVLVLSGLCVMMSGLFACDQLNKPMPVTSGGTSSSSSGAPPSTDAGSDADLPPLPSVTPQPGDTQL